MKLRRDHRIVAITALFAVGVPAAAALWIHARTNDLAAHLGRAGDVPARIGSVDADLTGTIRVSDVGVGKLISADSLEASVALDSLLDGQIQADEIRVAGPHISIAVDRDGDSDLARLVRRLARGHATGSRSGSRVRRIVVSSGTLVAKIADVGELSADAVELVPDAGGVRVITGALHVRGGTGSSYGEVDLARSAAELSLPHVHFGRVLAVAGTGRVHLGDQVITLRDVSIGRLSTDASLEARGFLDDGGVPRSISVELLHRDGFALSVRGDRVPLAPFGSLLPASLHVTGARASGEMTVRRAHDTLQLAIDGSVAGVRIDHKTIAPEPVPVDAAIAATLTIGPQAIAVQQARLSLGQTHWSASGWLRRGSPMSGQLDVQLAPADCMDLVHSLPVEIRGPLDGIAMTGTLGGHARLSIDLAAPLGEGVDLETSLANTCDVTAEPPAADVRTLIVDRSTLPDSWVSISRLPRYVPDAFVSAEDGRFWSHAGFDVEQIARSVEIDLRDRKISRGGSTISQQLIKNAFLTQRRSFDRKVQEAVLTWRLEARLEKKWILERYLNIIELGPRMFGLRPAANYWFGRSPRELTLKQAAFLAALTSEPTSMGRRVRQAGGLDPQSAERVDIILRAMYRDGVISKDDVTAAREDTMHFSGSALRHEI
jgi:hypothetical protein